MNELIYRSGHPHMTPVSLVLGAVLTVGGLGWWIAVASGPGPWPVTALVCGVVLLYSAFANASWTRAEPDALRLRSPLRERVLSWDELADFRVVRVKQLRGGDFLRVAVVLTDGRELLLPQPRPHQTGGQDFESQVRALRGYWRQHRGSGPLPAPAALSEVSRFYGSGTATAYLVHLLVLGAAAAGVAWIAGIETEARQAAGDRVAAAVLGLAAGYSAAQLTLCLRHRRRPPTRRRPSAGPFVAALAGTALWLLPLCWLDALTPPSVGAGALLTAGLLAWAWRATGPAALREVSRFEEATAVRAG
ncbi:PH domain-containing protein [Kitasatospora sp. NPDC051853]|uniref:PH domain-containing protein n=1 Tax=Kitasatospora sp. NPDC051853 TaxID=3364058 RepID=UPI0037AF457A